MLSLQQMQYILSLHKNRHFQRASDECFVTQPTLSMQIKKAEDELGYSIFDRSRQPIELTPFGERLLPVLMDIMNEAEKIPVITEQMKGTYKERIRLGIIPTIGSYMVPDLFSKWLERLDDIQLNIVEMKTDELLVALEKKELDAIIIAGPHSDQRYRNVPLFTEEILAYIPKFAKNEITTEELKEMRPWLLSSGNCLRSQMIRFCQLKDDTEKQEWNYEGGNLDLLLSMVDQYGGYTLVPKQHHLDPQKQHAIKRIFDPQHRHYPAREIIALSPSRSAKWPAIERIIREVQLNYGSMHSNEFEVLEWK
jgi:LysR family transcriptional regulator, hydrogen peroxide-inducible genes activator